MPEITAGDVQRFWKFVKIMGPDECWEWQGALFGPKTYQYGSFRLGTGRKAHRVSWKIHTGKEPIDRVLHKCDNPICVNPNHLFEGSPLDNARDRDRKGRGATGDKNGSRLYPERLLRGDTHWTKTHPEKIFKGDGHWTKTRPQRGEDSGMSKLTENDVLDIRSLKFLGGVAKDIAAAFSITRECIYFIWKRKTWRHI